MQKDIIITQICLFVIDNFNANISKKNHNNISFLNSIVNTFGIQWVVFAPGVKKIVYNGALSGWSMCVYMYYTYYVTNCIWFLIPKFCQFWSSGPCVSYCRTSIMQFKKQIYANKASFLKSMSCNIQVFWAVLFAVIFIKSSFQNLMRTLASETIQITYVLYLHQTLIILSRSSLRFCISFWVRLQKSEVRFIWDSLDTFSCIYNIEVTAQQNLFGPVLELEAL